MSRRDPALSVDDVMRLLPERFDAARVNGWAATFHFDIEGAPRPAWTVRVGGDGCRVERGHHGEHDCHVRMSQNTFLGLQSGEVNPQSAFLFGRIRVSDLGQMMRFVQAFGL